MKTLYDYYTIHLPNDLFQSEPTSEEWGQQAVMEAEERARLYTVPCEWTVYYKPELNNGGEYAFRVRRRRRRI